MPAPCASPWPLLQEFKERHGLAACMVAPTKIIAGLGMSLGIHVLQVPGTTGDYRTLFHRQAQTLACAPVCARCSLSLFMAPWRG